MHYRFDPFIEPSRALSISYACWIFQEVSSTYLQQDRRPCRFVWICPADLLSSIYYSSPAGKAIFNPFSNHMLFVKNHAITIKLSIYYLIYRNFSWILLSGAQLFETFDGCLYVAWIVVPPTAGTWSSFHRLRLRVTQQITQIVNLDI